MEKFLLDNASANTDATIAPTYTAVDYARWFQWWGTGNPVFPDPGDTYTVTFEAECATVGTNWDILTDAQASNGYYVTVKPGVQSLSAAPTGSQDFITIPFSLTTNGNFAVLARLNCPTADDDSFWVRMDNGSFVMRNGLGTSGWQWITEVENGNKNSLLGWFFRSCVEN